jgi:hypothetical protein
MLKKQQKIHESRINLSILAKQGKDFRIEHYVQANYRAHPSSQPRVCSSLSVKLTISYTW